MLTVSTPYLQVQAIRRMYRDQGKPTLAKPAWYTRSVNFAGTATGERARDVLDIDPDSDFVLLSIYHYYQNGAYSPDVGSTAANAESGQFLADNILNIHSNIVEVRFVPMASGRPLHRFGPDVGLSQGNSAHMSNAPLDFIMWTALGVGFSGDWEVGQYPFLAHPFEGDQGAGGAAFNALSVWRGWLTEPVILPAGSQLEVGIRRKVAVATKPVRGHLFLFWGVRLYVGRA